MNKQTFSQEVRENMSFVFNGYCSFEGCLEKAVDGHHKLPNTKVNQRKFPLFLQSPINFAPGCRKHHQDGKLDKITEKEAEVYEWWLEKLIGEEKLNFMENIL